MLNFYFFNAFFLFLSLESYINAKYKEHVKQDGGHEQMTELEILMGQGQWAQCLEKAQLAGEETLQKYLALRASALLKVR